MNNKALRDIEHLVGFMACEQNQPHKLMLFDFADGGDALPLHILELSVHRTDTVADQLIGQGLRPARLR